MHPKVACLALLIGSVSLVASIPRALADPVAVTVQPLADIARYPERSAPATVVAMSQPEVAAEIAARIEEILPLPGEVVPTGAALVRLDCRDYDLAAEGESQRLAALEAQIGLAEKKLARAEKLAASQLQAVDIVDERRAQLVGLRAERAAQRAALDRARYAQARCTVKAPARALVTAWQASPGDYAVPGTPMVSLIDLSSLELRADVYAPDALALDAARPSLRFVAGAQGDWPVSLRVAVGAVDPAARTREVRALFLDDAAVLPGSAGRLVWRDARPHLPANFIVERAGVPGVFVEEGGAARFVPLPDAEVGRDTPVSLPLDSLIIEEGRFAVSDGAAVRRASGSGRGASEVASPPAAP